MVCRSLGFSEEEIEGAFAIRGEREYAAAGGPIWIRIEQESNNAIPGNVVAKGCLGTESTLTECNVREPGYIIMFISTDL